MSEKKQLMLVIAAIVILSAFASFIVYGLWFKESKHNVYIGVVTSDNGYQQSVKNGIAAFVQQVDNTRFVNPKNIKVITFDAFSPKLAEEVDGFIKQNDVIGFISHSDFPETRQLANRLKAGKIPLINIASIDTAAFKDDPQFYSTAFNAGKQARFIANYARNVLGFIIITIIHDNTEHGAAMARQFGEVYERFGTKIHYTFAYDKAGSAQAIGKVVNEIKGKQDLGTVFFIGSAADSASFAVQARDANINNKIIGTDTVATDAFNKALTQIAKNKPDLERYTNEILFSAPLLFDTAGYQEQQFKNDYLQRYGAYPDWVSAYSYDAAQLLLTEVLKRPLSAVSVEKETILKYIDGLNAPGHGLNGATGDTWFNESREAQKTIQIGIYDGHNIIAAPTQLQPIKSNTQVNYIDEIKSGKMLYVNDRFMYKTNVVYTGIELNDISKFDTEGNTAELAFSIWFRYRGNFDPGDLLFTNAASDLSLGDPVQSYEKDKVMFKRYKLKHVFKTDFSTRKFRYGSHALGISYRHKSFNKNNVIYVIDDLGMNLNRNSSLKDRVIANNVLNSMPKWKIIAAQFFQSIIAVSSFGEPNYVGYGAIEPDFSKVDYQVLIAEDRFNFNDYVNARYFIYIGIFGVLGSIAARMIDHKYNRKTRSPAKQEDAELKDDVIMFWMTSSWVMRIVFWFVSLLAIGNLGIEIAIDKELSSHYIDWIVMAYDMLWWILAAILTHMALNRFVFSPLEKKSQRKIPAVLKNLAISVIYLLCLFCIVAFVLNKPLSSLMATSGLFAMIIGLGVRGNIANIVSGVIVNLERPFSIGDFIKIKGFEKVEVVDMNWRSLKVKDANYNIISIPNSSVGSSEIINYFEKFSKIEFKLNLSPIYEPDVVLSHIKSALAKVKGIHDIKPPEQFFTGIVLEDNASIAEYLISFSIYEYKKHKLFRDEIWKALYHEFSEVGMNLDLAKDRRFSK